MDKATLAMSNHPDNVLDYTIVRDIIWNDLDKLHKLIKNIEEVGMCGFDLESSSPTSIKVDYSKHKRESFIVGASIAYIKDKTIYTYYLPFNHKKVVDVLFRFVAPKASKEDKVENPLTYVKERLGNQLESNVFVNAFNECIIQNPDVTLVGHNLIYDLGVVGQNLLRQGKDFTIKCKVKDSMISSYLLHKERKGLKFRSKIDLYYDMEILSDIVTDYSRLDETTIQDMCCYAQDDAWTPLLLIKCHEESFTKHKAHQRKQTVFDDIENPTAVALTIMEHTGMKVDINRMQVIHSNLTEQIKDLESKCFDIIGRKINLRSTDQVSALLFDDLEWWKPMSVWNRNRKGLYSCDKFTLEDLDYYDDLTTEEGKLFVELYKNYNSLCTLVSSFTGKIPFICDDNWRVHCRYNQTVTATNRLSSSDPNLQNIPSRSKNGKLIRSCFIAENGWSVVAADYSQMELRILAHLTNDEMLIKAFREEIDIHTLTSELVGVDRSTAKTINYSVTYGTGAARLGRTLKIPKEQAQEYLDTFLDKYSGLKWYKSAVEKLVNKRQYTKTLFGNTRFYHKDIANGWYWINKAVNHPVQGTSADIVKMAMVSVYNWLVRDKLLHTKVKMCAQVHDEIVFEVRNDFVEEFQAIVYDIMMGVCDLIVPMVVDVCHGKNWAEAH